MIILRQKQYSLKATRALAGFNKTVRRMNPYQAKRAAITTEKKAFRSVANAKNSIENAYLNPGRTVDNLVEASARNPIAVGSNVAGKALMVAPVPVAVKAAPIGAGGIALETALKKKVPSYGKITEKLADKYKGAEKFRSRLRSIGDMGFESARLVSQAV